MNADYVRNQLRAIRKNGGDVRRERRLRDEVLGAIARGSYDPWAKELAQVVTSSIVGAEHLRGAA